jgi:hypothetical protein
MLCSLLATGNMEQVNEPHYLGSFTIIKNIAPSCIKMKVYKLITKPPANTFSVA